MSISTAERCKEAWNACVQALIEVGRMPAPKTPAAKKAPTKAKPPAEPATPAETTIAAK
jgi:hypothetical protein